MTTPLSDLVPRNNLTPWHQGLNPGHNGEGQERWVSQSARLSQFVYDYLTTDSTLNLHHTILVKSILKIQNTKCLKNYDQNIYKTHLVENNTLQLWTETTWHCEDCFLSIMLFILYTLPFLRQLLKLYIQQPLYNKNCHCYPFLALSSLLNVNMAILTPKGSHVPVTPRIPARVHKFGKLYNKSVSLAIITVKSLDHIQPTRSKYNPQANRVCHLAISQLSCYTCS